MKSYTHLLFDLDRTLWDFEANSKEVLLDIYIKYNLDKKFGDFNCFLDIYKKINLGLWEKYRNKIITKDELSWQRFFYTIQTREINDKNIAKSIAQDYIDNSPLKTTLFPNTKQILNYLSKSYKLYIITNGFKEIQYNKLRNCNIINYFEKVYVSEEVGTTKPDVAFFRFVLNDLGISKNEALVIGDDLDSDIKGANNSQIDSVWFNPEKTKEIIKPTYTISDLLELKKIL